MKILMIPTSIVMLRVVLLMIFMYYASGKLAANLRQKSGKEDIFKKIISPESILSLIAYLVIYYVFSLVWPLGWEIFNSTSGIFWPVQGLIILALIGWIFLERLRFLPWFFLAMAAVLTVLGFMRDPRINFSKLGWAFWPQKTEAVSQPVQAETETTLKKMPVVSLPQVKPFEDLAPRPQLTKIETLPAKPDTSIAKIMAALKNLENKNDSVKNSVQADEGRPAGENHSSSLGVDVPIPWQEGQKNNYRPARKYSFNQKWYYYYNSGWYDCATGILVDARLHQSLNNAFGVPR